MNAAITQPILDVVRDWTGVAVTGCPWNVFHDPLVRRVIESYEAYDKGQLALVAPRPSHRLVAGVLYYSRALAACRSKRLEQDRERAEREHRSRSQVKGEVIRGRG